MMDNSVGRSKGIKRSQGFTLIELLLGILIFSTVALTLYAVFAQGIKVQKRAKDEEQRFRTLRWAMVAVSVDLSNMAEFEVQLPQEDEPQGALLGSKDELNIYHFTQEGLEQIRYALKTPDAEWVYQTVVGDRSEGNIPIVVSYSEIDQQHRFLVREKKVVPLQDDEQRPTETEILFRQVVPGGLEFSYGKVSQPGDVTTLEWHDQWEEETLPALVKMTCTGSDPMNEQTQTWGREVLIPVGAW